RIEAPGEARGAPARALRVAPLGLPMGPRLAPAFRRALRRAVCLRPLVRAAHAVHAARGDALPARLLGPARAPAGAGRGRRRAAARSGLAAVHRDEPVRAGFSAARLRVPPAVPPPGRLPPDSPLLSRASEPPRGSPRARLASGVVAEAELRELRA